MFSPRIQKRLALCFGVFGIGLMGADLMLTGNVFVHVAELMAASIACFIIALLLDRHAGRPRPTDKK